MYCTLLAESTGRKNSPSAHHRTHLSGYISSQVRHVSTIGKNSYTAMSLPHVLTVWWTLAHLRLRSVGEFGASHSTGFTTWLHYCTDVAQRRSCKVCTMSGRLLGWYTMLYIHCRGSNCP